MNALIGMKPEQSFSDRPVTPRAVRTFPVKLNACVPKTPVEGRVESLYRMDILTETTGILLIGGKEFREGMEFTAGEVMLRLDATEARTQLMSQRSQFLQLLSNALADLKLDFESNWPAWEGFVNAVDVEATLPVMPEPGSDRERLFLANRGILSTYHTIRSAEERLEKYTVIAPFDGVVTAASVRPGGLVRAGQMAGVLVGRDAFEIKTAVHARYLTTVQLGDQVEFHDENGEVVARGTVHRIAGHVDPATQSASVFCRVSPVAGRSALLRDGRFLSGEIASDPIDSAVVVPLTWLDVNDAVYAIESESLVTRPVEVAFRSRSEAIVRGLDSGTVLLGEVLASAFDGMEVITEAAN